MRFVVEFFRTPDAQIGYIFGNWMTLGHAFSLIMILLSFLLSYSLKKK